MKKHLVLLVVGMALVLASGGEVWSQTSRPTKKLKKAASVKKAMKAEKIRGLSWHPSLEGAIAANKKAKSGAKPIFFLRVLGDLKGKT